MNHLWSPCTRCGLLTVFGSTCIFCATELAGGRVLATFGPPLDGQYFGYPVRSDRHNTRTHQVWANSRGTK